MTIIDTCFKKTEKQNLGKNRKEIKSLNLLFLQTNKQTHTHAYAQTDTRTIMS